MHPRPAQTRSHTTCATRLAVWKRGFRSEDMLLRCYRVSVVYKSSPSFRAGRCNDHSVPNRKRYRSKLQAHIDSISIDFRQITMGCVYGKPHTTEDGRVVHARTATSTHRKRAATAPVKRRHGESRSHAFERGVKQRRKNYVPGQEERMVRTGGGRRR